MAVTATSATAVSAFLRRSGWRPVPRIREGVQVTGSGSKVRVSFAWDYEHAKAARECAEAYEFLNEAGYVVESVGTAEIPALLVTGRNVP